jgi:hypothetical protein
MSDCKTCKHWTPYSAKYPDRAHREDKQAGGICGNDKLTENYGHHGADMLVYSYNEGGEFWTGPDFSCVHHEQKMIEWSATPPGPPDPDVVWLIG